MFVYFKNPWIISVNMRFLKEARHSNETVFDVKHSYIRKQWLPLIHQMIISGPRCLAGLQATWMLDILIPNRDKPTQSHTLFGVVATIYASRYRNAIRLSKPLYISVRYMVPVHHFLSLHSYSAIYPCGNTNVYYHNNNNTYNSK